jgi:hypothetical protein
MLTSWKQQDIDESGKMFVSLWTLNRATTAARCPDFYRCSQRYARSLTVQGHTPNVRKPHPLHPPIKP